jgi:hypothetical protein
MIDSTIIPIIFWEIALSLFALCTLPRAPLRAPPPRRRARGRDGRRDRRARAKRRAACALTRAPSQRRAC